MTPQDRDETWKRRIGGDPWKNVIMLECAAAAHTPQGKKPVKQSNPSDFNRPIDLVKTAFEYRIVDDSSGPFRRSYLVVQAGRLFVVGPTSDAVWALENIGFPTFLNVVVLNWECEHNKALPELLNRYGEKVTIWTSHWIWEETLRVLEKTVGPMGGKPGQVTLRLFDGGQPNYRKYFTTGVGLDLAYSCFKQPFLRAEFRCNHQVIRVDPAQTCFPLAEEEFAAYMVKKYLASAQEHPQFRNEILSRYADVASHIISFDPVIWRRRCPGLADPVDLTPYGKDIKRFAPLEFNSAIVHRGTGDSGAPGDISLLDKTAVLILCGGLMDRAERELIDPGYELDVVLPGDKTERRMSILEWRLNQLEAWTSCANEKDRMPVLLLTTPDTEDIVDRCCHQYQHRLEASNRNSRLQVTRVAAQLTPEIEYHEGTVRWLTSDGGAWKLHPSGHMDCLRILVNERNQERLLAKRDFTIIFAFNNLGDVINPDTLNRLQQIGDSAMGRTRIGIELFKYQAPEGIRSLRWNQLSYCDNPDAPRLVKSGYSTKQIAEAAILLVTYLVPAPGAASRC